MGNLFVDGFDSSNVVQLAKLPKGRSTLVAIVMNQTIGFPGDVAWDGEFLAVGDQLTNTIYQFKVSGVHASVQGSTVLSGATDVFQFFPTGASTKHPQATAVVGADFGGNAVDQCHIPRAVRRRIPSPDWSAQKAPSSASRPSFDCGVLRTPPLRMTRCGASE